MEDIVLVGFGGHAKSVADTIERTNKYNIVGYTDFYEHESKYKYLGNDDSLIEIYESGVHNAFICLGYMGKSSVREDLYGSLKKLGYSIPIIVDPSAIIAQGVKIDEGTFIGKAAIVNAEAYIGKMSIINTKALIEHECFVGDYSHVAVGAVLCGRVKLGKGVFVGANATVAQCAQIDDYEFIGAGSMKISNKNICFFGGVSQTNKNILLINEQRCA